MSSLRDPTKRNLRTFDHVVRDCVFCPSREEDLAAPTRLDVPSLSRCRQVSRHKRVILLDGVLSRHACDELIKVIEPHFRSLRDEFLPSEREADRVMCHDPNFAEWLAQRVFPFLSSSDPTLGFRPWGFGVLGGGEWKPDNLNPCLRYGRYRPGSQGFRPHRDATYIKDEDTRSVLTLILYLDDQFEGGDTVFYRTTQPRRLIEQTVAEEMEGGFVEKFRVRPRPGRVLLFDHNMIHSGEPVHSSSSSEGSQGGKHFLRTDVVYRRTWDHEIHGPRQRLWLQDPLFLRCVELYREAINRELDGDLEKSSELFSRALSIRQCVRT